MSQGIDRREFTKLLLIAASAIPISFLGGCGVKVKGILPDLLAWRQHAKGKDWFQISQRYKRNPDKYKDEMVFYLLSKIYSVNPALAEEIGKLDTFRYRIFQVKDVEILKDVVNYYLRTTYGKATEAFGIFLTDAQEASAGVVSSHMIFTTYLQRFLYAVEERKYPLPDPKAKFATPSPYSMDSIIDEFWDFRTNPKWRKGLNAVATRLSSPRDIYRYMLWNIIYYPDFTSDSLQSPQETHRLKRGDCEDQALYAAFLLERIGEVAMVLSVKYSNSMEIGTGIERSVFRGHTAALFKRCEGYFILENGTTPRAGRPRGILGPFASLREAAKFLSLNFGLQKFQYFNINDADTYRKFWSQGNL